VERQHQQGLPWLRSALGWAAYTQERQHKGRDDQSAFQRRKIIAEGHRPLAGPTLVRDCRWRVRGVGSARTAYQESPGLAQRESHEVAGALARATRLGALAARLTTEVAISALAFSSIIAWTSTPRLTTSLGHWYRCRRSLAVLNHDRGDSWFTAKPSYRFCTVQSATAPLNAGSISERVGSASLIPAR